MTAIAVTVHEFRALRTALLCRTYQAECPRCELVATDVDASGLQAQQERVTGTTGRGLGDGYMQRMK